MEVKEKIKELENQIEKLKKEEEMEQWFKSLLNGIEIEINENNLNPVYYKKNGRIFFELYQISEKILYCDYDLVWSVFHNRYNLNYYETQAFIKSMVEQHLKLEMVTPMNSMGMIVSLVEKHLKLEK
jgi:hypothetical protein